MHDGHDEDFSMRRFRWIGHSNLLETLGRGGKRTAWRFNCTKACDECSIAYMLPYKSFDRTGCRAIQHHSRPRKYSSSTEQVSINFSSDTSGHLDKRRDRRLKHGARCLLNFLDCWKQLERINLPMQSLLWKATQWKRSSKSAVDLQKQWTHEFSTNAKALQVQDRRRVTEQRGPTRAQATYSENRKSLVHLYTPSRSHFKRNSLRAWR